jgi:4-hydroxybenzoate polyprenyltransferase
MERAGWIRSGRARTLLELGRVSNVPTVWSNVTAGWLLAGGGWNAQFFVLCLGASLLYVAGMFLNDAFDAAWDRTHRPERPIPSGRISHRAVWAIGWGLLLLGAVIVGAVFLAGERAPFLWWSLAPLIICIILYDWWHKKSAWSALLMAACRFFLVAIAIAAAVTSKLPALSVIHPVWLAAYILAITLIARSEARGKEPFPFAPAICFVLAITLLLPVEPKLSNFQWWAGVVFAAVFMIWVKRGIFVQRSNPSPDRVGRLVSHLLAGIIAFDCVAIATVDLAAAFFVLALLPITVWLQRFVPAT